MERLIEVGLFCINEPRKRIESKSMDGVCSISNDTTIVCFLTFHISFCMGFGKGKKVMDGTGVYHD